MSEQLSLFEGERLETIYTDGCWHHSSGQPENEPEVWRRVKVLGRGSYGTLLLAHGPEGAVRAIKEISRVTTSTEISTRELQALVKLKSYPDHFVQFFGWWTDDDSIFFAMEYMEEGDLMALIQRQELSEDDARMITSQLLHGIEIMHDNNLCHRDLKPQNVLVVSATPGAILVKIADFGCAKYAVGTQLRTAVGTNGYIAPEVWGYGDSETSVYSFGVDMWSLGCLTYTVLTKEPPLKDFRQYFGYTNGGEPFLQEGLAQHKVSQLGVEFITNAMAPLPKNRLTVSRALCHPWVTGRTGEELDNRVENSSDSYAEWIRPCEDDILAYQDSSSEEYFRWVPDTFVSPEVPENTPLTLYDHLGTPLIARISISNEECAIPPSDWSGGTFCDYDPFRSPSYFPTYQAGYPPEFAAYQTAYPLYLPTYQSGYHDVEILDGSQRCALDRENLGPNALKRKRSRSPVTDVPRNRVKLG